MEVPSDASGEIPKIDEASLHNTQLTLAPDPKEIHNTLSQSVHPSALHAIEGDPKSLVSCASGRTLLSAFIHPTRSLIHDSRRAVLIKPLEEHPPISTHVVDPSSGRNLAISQSQRALVPRDLPLHAPSAWPGDQSSSSSIALAATHSTVDGSATGPDGGYLSPVRTVRSIDAVIAQHGNKLLHSGSSTHLSLTKQTSVSSARSDAEQDEPPKYVARASGRAHSVGAPLQPHTLSFPLMPATLTAAQTQQANAPTHSHAHAPLLPATEPTRAPSPPRPLTVLPSLATLASQVASVTNLSAASAVASPHQLVRTLHPTTTTTTASSSSVLARNSPRAAALGGVLSLIARDAMNNEPLAPAHTTASPARRRSLPPLASQAQLIIEPAAAQDGEEEVTVGGASGMLLLSDVHADVDVAVAEAETKTKTTPQTSPHPDAGRCVPTACASPEPLLTHASTDYGYGGSNSANAMFTDGGDVVAVSGHGTTRLHALPLPLPSAVGQLLSVGVQRMPRLYAHARAHAQDTSSDANVHAPPVAPYLYRRTVHGGALKEVSAVGEHMYDHVGRGSSPPLAEGTHAFAGPAHQRWIRSLVGNAGALPPRLARARAEALARMAAPVQRLLQRPDTHDAADAQEPHMASAVQCERELNRVPVTQVDLQAELALERALVREASAAGGVSGAEEGALPSGSLAAYWARLSPGEDESRVQSPLGPGAPVPLVDSEVDSRAGSAPGSASTPVAPTDTNTDTSTAVAVAGGVTAGEADSAVVESAPRALRTRAVSRRPQPLVAGVAAPHAPTVHHRVPQAQPSTYYPPLLLALADAPLDQTLASARRRHARSDGSMTFLASTSTAADSASEPPFRRHWRHAALLAAIAERMLSPAPGGPNSVAAASAGAQQREPRRDMSLSRATQLYVHTGPLALAQALTRMATRAPDSVMPSVDAAEVSVLSPSLRVGMVLAALHLILLGTTAPTDAHTGTHTAEEEAAAALLRVVCDAVCSDEREVVAALEQPIPVDPSAAQRAAAKVARVGVERALAAEASERTAASAAELSVRTHTAFDDLGTDPTDTLALELRAGAEATQLVEASRDTDLVDSTLTPSTQKSLDTALLAPVGAPLTLSVPFSVLCARLDADNNRLVAAITRLRQEVSIAQARATAAHEECHSAVSLLEKHQLQLALLDRGAHTTAQELLALVHGLRESREELALLEDSSAHLLHLCAPAGLTLGGEKERQWLWQLAQERLGDARMGVDVEKGEVWGVGEEDTSRTSTQGNITDSSSPVAHVTKALVLERHLRWLAGVERALQAAEREARANWEQTVLMRSRFSAAADATVGLCAAEDNATSERALARWVAGAVEATPVRMDNRATDSSTDTAAAWQTARDNPFLAALAALPSLTDVALASAARGLPSDDLQEPLPERAPTPRPLRSRRRGARSATTSLLDAAFPGGSVATTSTTSVLRCPRCGSTSAEPEHMPATHPTLESLPIPLATPARVLSPAPALRRSPRKRLGAQTVASPALPPAPAATGPPPCPCAVERAWATCDEDELYLHAVRAYGRSGRGKTSRRAKPAPSTSASVPTPASAPAAMDAGAASVSPNTIIMTPPPTTTAAAASAPCSSQEVVLHRILSTCASPTHPIRAFTPFAYHTHQRTPLTASAAVPIAPPTSSLSETVWAPALPFLPLPSLLHLNAHLPRLPPTRTALLSHVLTFFSVLTSTFRQAHLARVSLPLPSHVYARHLLATHAQAPLGLVPATAASTTPAKAPAYPTADSTSPESSLLALLARGDAAVADVAQTMRADVSTSHRQGPSRGTALMDEFPMAAHAETAIQLALPASSPLAAAAHALAAQAGAEKHSMDSVNAVASAPAPSRAAAASLPPSTAVSALLLAHAPMLVSATNALYAAAQHAHLPLYHLFLATLVGAAPPTAYAESEAYWRFEQQRIAHYVHVRLVAATALALARELSGADRPTAVAAASTTTRAGTRSMHTYARTGTEVDSTELLATRLEGQNGVSNTLPSSTTFASPLSSANTAANSPLTTTLATAAVTDPDKHSQLPTERAPLPMLHVDASTPMSARNSPVKAPALTHTRTRRRADEPPLTARAQYDDLQDDANGRASFSGGATARGAAMAVLASFASPRAQTNGDIVPPPSARALLSPRARTLAAHATVDGSVPSLSELSAYKSAVAKLRNAAPSSRSERADRPSASSSVPIVSATARHISSLFTRPIRHALLSRLAATPASPHVALTQPPGPSACGLWLARGQVFASERAFLALLADLYPHKGAAQRMQLFAAAAQHPVASPVAVDASPALYQNSTQPTAISLSSLLAPVHRHAIAPGSADTLPRASFAAVLTHQHATNASTLLLCSLRCALYRLAALPERALAHLDADWRSMREATRATASANTEASNASLHPTVRSTHTAVHAPSSMPTGSSASSAASAAAASVGGWMLAPYGAPARRGSQPGGPTPRTCACCYASEVIDVDGYPASPSAPSSPTSSTTSLALVPSFRRATSDALTLTITRARKSVPWASTADRRVWAPALPAMKDSDKPFPPKNVWIRVTAQQASVHRTGVCPCLLLERYTHALLAHVSHGAPKPTHPLVHLYGHAEGPHVSLRHLRLALHLVVPQLHLIDVARLCSVAFAGAEVDVHAAARLELVLQRLSLAGLLSVPRPHPLAGSDTTRPVRMAALADAVAADRDATFAPSASPIAAGAELGAEERRGRITRLRKQTDVKVDIPVYLCGDCAYSTTMPTIPPCSVCRHIVCEHMSLEKLLGASGAGGTLTHALSKPGASACGARCCSSRGEPHAHAYLQLYHPLMAHVGEQVLSTGA